MAKSKPTVILIQPIVGSLDGIKDRPAVPLSLITASTYLVNDNTYDVLIIDQRLSKDWKNYLKESIKNTDQLICVGTTAMLGAQIEYALDGLRAVKEINPKIPTVWGGPQGGILPEITIEHPLIDYLIQGDAEKSFRKLVDCLYQEVEPYWVPGVYTKQGKSIEDYSLLDINELEEPPYEIVKVSNYLPKRFGVPSLDVETSRGCPFNCAFCYNPSLHQRKWRALTSERTLRRLDNLKSRYCVESFWFIDDEFFVDLKRAQEIIEGVIERKYRWSVQGTTIANCLRMSDTFLKLLHRSGCKQLNIGVESGSEELLKKMNKPITNEQVLEVNSKLAKFDIVPSYYFIVGFPDETENDFSQTLKLVENIFK